MTKELSTAATQKEKSKYGKQLSSYEANGKVSKQLSQTLKMSHYQSDAEATRSKGILKISLLVGNRSMQG